LLIGCSNAMNLHKSFEAVFGKHEYTNLSMAGFGNEYICSRLFEHIEYEGTLDFVYLQFSGLYRIDVPFAKKFKISDYDYTHSTKHFNWVASGGLRGSWMGNEYIKTHLIGRMPLFGTEASGQVSRSLQNIFSAIELLKKMQIPFKWTSYYDYLNPPTQWIKDNDGGMDSFPEWLDTSDHLGDTPYEHAQKEGDPIPDHVHYSEKSERNFFKKHKDKFSI